MYAYLYIYYVTYNFAINFLPRLYYIPGSATEVDDLVEVTDILDKNKTLIGGFRF